MPAILWIVLAFVAGAIFPALGLLCAAGAIGYYVAIKGTTELNQLTDVEYVERLVAREQQKRLK